MPPANPSSMGSQTVQGHEERKIEENFPHWECYTDHKLILIAKELTLHLQKEPVSMEPQEDVIVDIPENRIRYFGTTGKMLLPSPTTIATWINKIPERHLMTTDLLRKKLTEQFKVQGTCPVTTQKALQTVAHHESMQVAYWRMLKKNGELIASFPGGVEGHAARLRKEGFVIDTSGKHPKIQDFATHLAQF
jgi:hypothetical protein